MKIKELRLKNFAKFEDFELVFGNHITHLVGINGSGKTTVGLVAIWAGFKGIAEKSGTGQLIGERFRFISPGKKSLDIKITLQDEQTNDYIYLKRHITKRENQITITSDSKRPLTKEYIENLFNISFMSASHFASLTGQEQAAAMGIDTGKFDSQLAMAKAKAADIRRDIKKIGELVPVDKCERIEWEDLQEKRNNAVRHNQKQEDIVREKEDMEKAIASFEERIKDLQEPLNELKQEIEALPEPGMLFNLEEIEEEVTGVVENNERASKYETYIESCNELKALETSLENSKSRQEDITAERSTYLQGATFGIKGLQIDEKGQLTKNDKLIRTPYFSKGELEMIVARIGISLNPELKVRFVDDFELLDTANQKKLVTNLSKRGFQIITASVGDTKSKENSVLLRGCKVVDGSGTLIKEDSNIEPAGPEEDTINESRDPGPDPDEEDYY